MTHRQKTAGFTLLEILIALFIFTIVAAIVTRSLHTVITLQESAEKRVDAFSDVQRVMIFFAQDFGQIIDRPVINAKNMLENAVLGSSNTITFTHGGLLNPLWQANRSTLQRVRYRLQKDILWRDTWAELDQISRSVPESRALLKDVTALHFQYLDNGNQFRDEWPMAVANTDAAGLPRAIQVTLTLKNQGNIKRLYIVSGKKIEKPR